MPPQEEDIKSMRRDFLGVEAPQEEALDLDKLDSMYHPYSDTSHAIFPDVSSLEIWEQILSNRDHRSILNMVEYSKGPWITGGWIDVGKDATDGTTEKDLVFDVLFVGSIWQWHVDST
jgi:hypothetical protein